MGSTSPGFRGLGRRALLTGGMGVLAGCATDLPPPPWPVPPPVRDGAFLMPDGTSLPYRAWPTAGIPTAVVLALHGFGDSRDAWEWPAPVFASFGVAVYAPDQRGFGQTATRGHWAGAEQMTDDAAEMLGQLRLLHPGRRLFIIGESMGGAVAMRLAATRRPELSGIVLAAPAVWGRAGMNLLLRGGLFVLSHGLPGVTVMDGGPIRVRATDNPAALRRLSRDPLTMHGTRFDTLRGLVDLMDDALAAAPGMPAPTLAMYGGHDEVIPPEATAAMWRVLTPPPGARRAFYPNAWHLMLRDRGNAVPIGDILGWMADPAVPLPAEAAAAAWLATQT